MKGLYKRSVALCILVLAAVAVVGCDSVAPTSTDTAVVPVSQNGNLRVLLTDAPFPFDLVDSTNVTIEQLGLVGDETITLIDTAQTYNLLALRDGVTALMSEADVPAGRYTSFRLEIGPEARVVLKDGKVFPLKVPSGTIRLVAADIEVSDTTRTTVVLDFNVEESFVVQGNPDTPAGIRGFLFKPVIKLQSAREESRDDEAEGAVDQDEGEAQSDEDDGDAKQSIEGAVTAVGTTQLEVQGIRYEVGSGTELDGLSALRGWEAGSRVEIG